MLHHDFGSSTGQVVKSPKMSDNQVDFCYWTELIALWNGTSWNVWWVGSDGSTEQSSLSCHESQSCHPVVLTVELLDPSMLFLFTADGRPVRPSFGRSVQYGSSCRLLVPRWGEVGPGHLPWESKPNDLDYLDEGGSCREPKQSPTAKERPGARGRSSESCEVSRVSTRNTRNTRREAKDRTQQLRRPSGFGG